MAKNELYINVEIGENTHRIDIAHDDEVCDGEISLDGKKIETDASIISGGARFKFEAEGIPVIILILEKDGEYDYDCFVNGISVKNNMPFEIDGYTYPKALAWKKKRMDSKQRYIVVEALKGVIVGCIIFLALYFIQYVSDSFSNIFNRNWMIFMPICLVLPTLLFTVLAGGDYKKNEEAYEKFKKYQDK